MEQHTREETDPCYDPLDQKAMAAVWVGCILFWAGVIFLIAKLL